jgi:hypothetical protein
VELEALQAVPLTRREAQYLTDLAYAARNYHRTLRAIEDGTQRERLAMASGHQVTGLSHQELAEASSQFGALRALIDGRFYAQDMTDNTVWRELFTAAYTRTIDVFRAAEPEERTAANGHS